MKAAAFSLLVAVAALLTACSNMQDQRNRRPLTPSPHFADGTSARTPPAHTFARDARPAGDPVLTGLRDGQPVAAIPLPVTRAFIERGRERYNIYCIVCHGAAGYSGGIVVRRGFPPPPSYHDDRLRQAPAGHFFDVITNGYGVMYPYGDRIAPADRWAIVAYIRALQRSQHATLADVPPAARSQLTPP